MRFLEPCVLLFFETVKQLLDVVFCLNAFVLFEGLCKGVEVRRLKLLSASGF